MCPPDEADHAEMTGYVLEEKRARERFAEARERFQLWEGRLEMAQKARRFDLVEMAEQEMREARVEALAAKQRFEHLKSEKAMLRVGSRLREHEGAEMVAHGEAVLEQFRDLGATPEDEELRQLAKSSEADDMLSRLKNQMNKD